MKQQLDLEVKKFFDLLANTPSIKVKKQLLAEKRDDGTPKLSMTHSDMSSSPSGKCSKPIKSEN